MSSVNVHHATSGFRPASHLLRLPGAIVPLNTIVAILAPEGEDAATTTIQRIEPLAPIIVQMPFDEVSKMVDSL